MSKSVHESVVLSLEETSKLTEKYSMFGDDSSDEDDNVISYDGSEAKKQLKSFNEAHQNSQFGHNNLSFIAHAVAIKFLYSPSIQKEYYIKKKLLDSYFKIYSGVEKSTAIAGSITHLGNFHDSSYGGSEGKKLWNDIIESVHTEIQNRINSLEFYQVIGGNEFNGFFSDIIDKYHLNQCDFMGGRFNGLYTLNKTNYCPDKHDYTQKYNLSQSDNFSVEFFANLRLHNRLDKRLVKHETDTSMQDSKWQYSDSTEVTIKHGIEKSQKNTNRKEEVQFGELKTASYEKIYSSSLLTMKDLEELPEVFVKGADQLSNNAASLHYLLFGTEVIRNPSALIHNMMMLDLIKCGKLTWKKAFEDHDMPMSIQDAIVASRIKNSEYSEKYMPHKYLYEHKTYTEYAVTWTSPQRWHNLNYPTAEMLLSKEKELTKQWLEMKLGAEYLKCCLDKQGDIKIEHIEAVFSILQEACKEWYHIDLTANNSEQDIADLCDGVSTTGVQEVTVAGEATADPTDM